MENLLDVMSVNSMMAKLAARYAINIGMIFLRFNSRQNLVRLSELPDIWWVCRGLIYKFKPNGCQIQVVFSELATSMEKWKMISGLNYSLLFWINAGHTMGVLYQSSHIERDFYKNYPILS